MLKTGETATNTGTPAPVQSYVPKRQYIKRDANRWGDSTALTPQSGQRRAPPKAEHKLQVQQKQYARMREERSRNELPVPVGEPGMSENHPGPGPCSQNRRLYTC